MWLAWWTLLFWLWFAFVGEWDRYEWIAGGCAAAIGATSALVVRRLGVLRFRPQPRWIGRARRVPLQVLVDFGILALALAHTALGRRPAGAFRRKEFPGRSRDAEGAFRRGWVGVMATYSPNAYVVDYDLERGTVLLHDLVPNEQSEAPA